MAKSGTFLALMLGLSAQQPQVPALLQETLRRSPELRLLDPSIDLRGGYTIDEIRNFGYWPPWVVADLDGDKRPDVAATIVQRTSQGTRFAILAIHAQAPATVRWIVPLSAESLNGVDIDTSSGTVTPLYCLECDANPWYRWNGRAYEPALYQVGETISVAARDERQTLGLRGSPTMDSRLIARLDVCTTAKVLATRGVSYETRWYFVEVQQGKPVRGWIPASLANEMECIA